MATDSAARARLKELTNEVARKTLDNTLTNKRMDEIEAESEQLETQIKTYRKAVSMGDFASPYPSGDPADTPSGAGIPTRKSFAGLGRSEPKWQPPSPLQASHTELKQLFDAANHRAGGFQVQLGTKAYGEGSNIGMKTAGAPITETGGGFTLPSIMMPGLQMLLPYEPDRLFSHFQGAHMDGPSASFLQHTGNTNPAAAVGESQPKPDVGMQLAEQTVKPVKIAALASVSMEALMDYQSFADWIPLELTRALINAETNQIVNGDGTGANMTGILNTSGLLTRAQGGDTPIDAIQKAFNDLRTGAAFGTADLIALHPTTWNAIRRQKTTFNSYILSPDPSTGQVESLFGVTVVVNTFIPAGTAIVFDTTQAVLAWTRLGMVMQVNQFGDTEWTNNLVSFRVEERVNIGVRRPSAVVTVTGLPTS
jgi:HK97 family phage major capsid protein